MIFYVGDVWKPENTITDPVLKTKVDPSTVTAVATSPLGVLTSPEVLRIETGVYVCSIPLTEAGKWHVVFNATGEYAGSKPASITVQPV